MHCFLSVRPSGVTGPKFKTSVCLVSLDQNSIMAIANCNSGVKSCHWQVCSIQRQVAFLFVCLKLSIMCKLCNCSGCTSRCPFGIMIMVIQCGVNSFFFFFFLQNEVHRLNKMQLEIPGINPITASLQVRCILNTNHRNYVHLLNIRIV